MRRAPWLMALIAIAPLACSSTSFAPASKVDTLRVLAVKADLPFAKPGERVSLDALVAYPDGDASAVRFAWGTCLNPGSAEVADCARAVRSYARGGASFTVDVPGDALASLPSGAPAGMLGVVFVACAGELRDEATDAAPLSCYDARGVRVGRERFMWGMKRIIVTEALRNANPSIAAVSLDGLGWDRSTTIPIARCDSGAVADCPRELRHEVAIAAGPGSAESALGATEELVAFFYVSQGSVDDAYTSGDGTTFTTVLGATQAEPSTLITLWTVLRDDRGGVDWTSRTLKVLAR